jgi:hypothetical protein
MSRLETRLQRYDLRRELSAVRQFSQRTGERPRVPGGRQPSAGHRRETERSDFFDLNDGLALIRPAIQTRIVRQLQFMTLRTYGHAGRRDPQLLRAALVSSGP